MNYFVCPIIFEHGSHGFFFKKDKMADDLGQCLVISAWKLRIQYPHKIALMRIKSMRPPNYSEIRNGAGRNFMPEGQFYAIYWRWQFSGSLHTAQSVCKEGTPFMGTALADKNNPSYWCQCRCHFILSFSRFFDLLSLRIYRISRIIFGGTHL